MDEITGLRLWLVKSGLSFDAAFNLPDDEACLLANMLIGQSNKS